MPLNCLPQGRPTVLSGGPFLISKILALPRHAHFVLTRLLFISVELSYSCSVCGQPTQGTSHSALFRYGFCTVRFLSFEDQEDCLESEALWPVAMAQSFKGDALLELPAVHCEISDSRRSDLKFFDLHPVLSLTPEEMVSSCHACCVFTSSLQRTLLIFPSCYRLRPSLFDDLWSRPWYLSLGGLPPYHHSEKGSGYNNSIVRAHIYCKDSHVLVIQLCHKLN